MKSLAYKIVGNIHLVLHGASTPTDAEWNDYTDAVSGELQRGLKPAEMRTLVFSEGEGPSAAQRKRVNDILTGRATPVAIVSSSVMMRGIVTALQWFNPLMKVFAPDQVGDAFRFLKIQDRQHENIWKEAQKLQSALGVSNLKCLKGPLR